MSESIVFSAKAEEPPCSGSVLLHNKLPQTSQTSWLKITIDYYVSGFCGSGRQGTAGMHMSGMSAGLTQMAGAGQASLPCSLYTALYADSLGFLTAWQPEGSQTPCMVAQGSWKKDVEADSPLKGKAWSRQSLSPYPRGQVITDQARFRRRQHGVYISMGGTSNDL